MTEYIVPGIALLISFIALFISYGNRRSVLRKKIFSEQIEVAKKIQEITCKIEDLLDDIFAEKSGKVKTNMIHDLTISVMVFYQYMDAGSLFMDLHVFQKIILQYKPLN